MTKSASGKKGLNKHNKSKKEMKVEGGTEMGYSSDASASYSNSKSGGTKSCHY